MKILPLLIATTVLAMQPAVAAGAEFPPGEQAVVRTPADERSPVLIDEVGADACYLQQTVSGTLSARCTASNTNRPAVAIASSEGKLVALEDSVPLRTLWAEGDLVASGSIGSVRAGPDSQPVWEQLIPAEGWKVMTVYGAVPAPIIGHQRHPAASRDLVAYEIVANDFGTCTERTVVVADRGGTVIDTIQDAGRPDVRDVAGVPAVAFEMPDGFVMVSSPAGEFISDQSPTAGCRHSRPRLSPDGRLVVYASVCDPRVAYLEIGSVENGCAWTLAQVPPPDDESPLQYDINGDTVIYGVNGDVFMRQFEEVPGC